METPSASKHPSGDERLCRNISDPLTPLLDHNGRHPNLQIISYDSATIPTTPVVLSYDLQGKGNQSRHIRVCPMMGVSRSAILGLRKDPDYISRLLEAEKEIRNAMGRLVADTQQNRSSSTSSGEVVAGWVDGLENEKHDADSNMEEEIVLDDFASEDDVDQSAPDYFNGMMRVLRVGCSCVSGCYKSVVFAEDLADRPWPREWVIEVEHRSMSVSL